jgi:hypothetical protein
VRALTANELAILKDKWQSGPQGHSQRVLMTAYTPEFELQNLCYPEGCLMNNGQPCLLFNAQEAPYGGGDFHTYFMAYINEGAQREPIKLFDENTLNLTIANWRGKIVAVAFDQASARLRTRISTDEGLTWSAEADLMATAFTDQEVEYDGRDGYVALQLMTNKAGDTLYLFYLRDSDKHVVYRTTTNDDPTTGWSGEASIGMAITGPGRNYGGTAGINQDTSRSFAICETKTPGTWAMVAMSDDGDWHGSKAIYTGTLGGAWTRRLNDGYGGGLSGFTGSLGNIFRDRNGDLMAYAFECDGTGMGMWYSLDSGLTWITVFPMSTQIPTPFPAGGNVYGVGPGFGMYVPAHTFGEYVWASDPLETSIRVVKMNVAEPNIHILLGAGGANVAAVGETIDVSDRVISISLDKSKEMDSDTFNLELHNEDGAFNVNAEDGSGALTKFAKPNVYVEIEQWHGVVANAERTFYGITDSARQHDDPRSVVFSGRDRNKKLLTQEIRLLGPQDIDSVDKEGAVNYIRDTSNFVFLDKRLNDVIDFILDYAGIPGYARDLAPSNFLFREIRGSDGQRLIDFLKRCCDIAGFDLWADEDGLIRTRAIAHVPATSQYTFRSKEDIIVLDPDVDDDALKTRVRIYGKANEGAKYLEEQFKWPGLGAPAGIAYDKTTGHLWYLDQNSDLYRLSPTTNPMTIIEGPHALGLGYPDGITVDPLDNHLWISDGFNASVGNNVNRKFKKINRGTRALMLGPFTNPDGDHCDLWAWNDAGTIKIKMTTFTTGKIYTMNSTTGATISSVVAQVTMPTALDTDTGGGLYVSGWDAADFLQCDFAGNTVNLIKQPRINANEIATVDDPAAFDFGAVYEVFKDANEIIKYVPVTPTGVETAIYAEAVNVELERALIGEVRLARVTDLAVTDKAVAKSMAEAQMRRLGEYSRHITVGVLGNPGIQINDRVTITTPGAGVDSDWIVVGSRSDQEPRGGAYLMVLVLIPLYVGAVPSGAP